MINSICIPASRFGFTLIELSIALIIIGLVAGGVLVGQDLIRAAEIRKTISQKESFDAATNTFRSKYNCLPGDCAKASQFGFTQLRLGDPDRNNGNGNGMIGMDQGYETHNFFYHLVSAALIADAIPAYGKFTDYEFAPLGLTSPAASIVTSPRTHTISNGVSGGTGGWGILYTGTGCPGFGGVTGEWQSDSYLQDITGVHVYKVAETVNNDGWTVVRPSDAQMLDAKMDDGLPMTGMVRATAADYGRAGQDCGLQAAIAACANTTLATQAYTLSTTTPSCNVLIRSSI